MGRGENALKLPVDFPSPPQGQAGLSYFGETLSL